jgi:hypothetical protein
MKLFDFSRIVLALGLQFGPATMPATINFEFGDGLVLVCRGGVLPCATPVRTPRAVGLEAHTNHTHAVLTIVKYRGSQVAYHLRTLRTYQFSLAITTVH